MAHLIASLNGAVLNHWLRGLGWAIMLTLLLVSAACAGGPDFDTPPEIRYGEDVCQRCQMIINEARFAAAYVTADGQTRLFDDLGEMLAYHDEFVEEIVVYWVHDYDTAEWAKADSAYFVQSAEPTPMGFGLVAFTDRDRAEIWAADHAASVLTFDQLMAAD